MRTPFGLERLVSSLVLLLAVSTIGSTAHAVPPVPSSTDAPSEATTGDVEISQAPGREAVRTLRASLVPPTASSRWRGLPTFGRDIFPDATERFAPIENAPVGPDYVLGPGDNLMVFLSGLRDTSYALTLDREGRVFLPRVGATFLWGLRFADAEALLRSRLESMMRNVRIQVSMGKLRTVDVFVLGAVRHPGKVSVTGMATAFNALTAAGGPNELGSLRSIRVLRVNHEVARLDLYPFLLQGDRSQDVRLQDGDVVFTDLAGGHVGIQGTVVRPGVFEARGPVSLRALLAMAGGPTPFADLTRIRVERVDANGGFRLQDLPLDHGHGIDPDSLELFDFDLVTVLPLNQRLSNVVTLDGFVRHPGEYALEPGMRLSQLVTSDRVLPEADLDHAELRRVDSTTFHVTVRPFSVRELWLGRNDVTLAPLDAVSVFSAARLPRSITLDGEVVRPGTYAFTPGDRLSEILARAGGVTPQGWLPAAMFTRRTAAFQERRFMQDFLERQRTELARQQAELLQEGDSTSVVALGDAQSELLAAIARQSDPGRVVLSLDSDGHWAGTSRDPVLEDGDRLVVPLRPATVSVLGCVMNPGTMFARKSGAIDDYVKRAGGATRRADLSRAYLIKANGEARPRAVAGRVEPGDAVLVPFREINRGASRPLEFGARLLAELAGTAALIVAVMRR